MRTDEHEPTDDCADLHCYTHNVDEDARGAYRVCTECGHVFSTAAELVQGYEAMAADLLDVAQVPWLGLPLPPIDHIPIPPAEQILYCTLCAADFI